MNEQVTYMYSIMQVESAGVAEYNNVVKQMNLDFVLNTKPISNGDNQILGHISLNLVFLATCRTFSIEG